MAVIKKTLFPKNLDNYSVLVNDTDVDSKYFKVTSLPDAFTGGKNAFLIAGSEYLVPDTKIQIELKDASGNIIYHEPGEGYISSSLNGVPFVTEYYEGISKVVSVYVYPDTAYGPCTLTILGELSSYESDSGITSIVPLDWENKYNVKWQRQINVDPSLANTTKIRFYQRPQVTITEVLNPIYRIESGSKVDSGINQSFADIKLSNLETFAGDVKRVKVFRTSEGDISDYDLIQDILVESKELLTSYGLSGSVVGETGILTLETLKNYWNTGSLNAFLTSSRVESGVRLTGSGYFTYTSSLDIKSANTYELNLDAFYSASISTNLGIYLVSGSASSSIATLVGIQPTKNLLDTVIPFKIDKDFVSASLYFSQSQGEWHLGNISLKLSQDTAFSPDEIGFVTTMPTVIGNETYNFKFEFYDVNNNYVPVAVTQSATFTGGTNTSNTILLISASTSQSLAALTAVSSSISGTVTSNSSSTNIKINNVSSSISGSLYTLSGSIANELILTSGSVTLLSGSFLQFTQSITTTVNSLSQSVSASVLNISGAINAATASLSASLSASVAYTIYSASQYLDKFIFTDENGKINQTPTASSPGLYLGSDHLGYFSGSSWKTYMDNQGDFYLTGSTNNFLAWSSQLGTLQVQGVINIQGGNAATTSSLNNATSSLLGSINNATASLSSSLAPNIFTDVSGNIHRPPNVMVNYSNGLFLGSTHLGYYSGSDWKTYMQNNGNFFLSGAGSDSLSWSSGVLSINGAINITGGNAATTTNVSNAVTSGSTAAANAATSGSTAATNAVTSGSLFATNAAASASISASAVNDKVFTNSNGLINKTPTTGSTSGLYLGSTFLGYYNGTDWKTYMSNTGNFFLSGAGSDSLSWSSGVLTINGAINITGGNAATTTNVSNAVTSGSLFASNAVTSGSTAATNAVTSGSTAATNAVTSGSNAATNAVTSGSTAATNAVTSGSLFAANAAASASISASAVDDKVFTNALGRITKVPTSGSTAGLYLGSTNLGYYNGSTWRTYMDNSGLFYLTGSNNGNALLWDGSTLTIKGNLSVGSSVPNSVVSGLGSLALSSSVSTQQMTGLGSLALSSSVSTQQVSGLGSLALSSSVSTQQVSGLGSLALSSSVSTQQISGLGVLATRDTVAATHIDADAVTNAKIASDAVTAGKIATDAVTSGKISADAVIAGKIAADAVTATTIAAGAITAVKIAAGTITADKITTGTLTATQISSLAFTGKSASFDTGDIGGWSINSSNINKVGSTHTIKMDSANNAFTFTENSTSKLRMAITASTNIPDISITSQDSVTFTYTGTNRYSIATTGANTYNSGGDSNRILTATSGRGDGPVNLGYAGTGIIALTNPTEEIWVDTSEINADIFFMSVLNNVDTGDASSFTYQTYTLDLRVRKFADYTNANAETNVITTYTRRLAELTRFQSGNEPAPTDTINVNGASIEVTSAGNWFKVDLIQNMQTIVFEGGTSIMASSTFGEDFDGAITVRFGQIGNGYSILGPGGLQVYQGFRNYMKSAVASATGANFFEVQGKSTFLSGLSVSGSFSATTKQFQITHPLNEKKWLYHTSVESPRADLIYRGILQLENGSGSVGIDSSSRMTIGTFDTLTKERQLFLQNNDSFDRVMGKIESGSLYVISENTNATASINWLVTAERNDIELQKSNTYFDGKYKVEKYKSIYLKEIDDEIMSKFSGSI